MSIHRVPSNLSIGSLLEALKLQLAFKLLKGALLVDENIFRCFVKQFSAK